MDNSIAGSTCAFIAERLVSTLGNWLGALLSSLKSFRLHIFSQPSTSLNDKRPSEYCPLGIWIILAVKLVDNLPRHLDDFYSPRRV